MQHYLFLYTRHADGGNTHCFVFFWGNPCAKTTVSQSDPRVHGRKVLTQHFPFQTYHPWKHYHPCLSRSLTFPVVLFRIPLRHSPVYFPNRNNEFGKPCNWQAPSKTCKYADFNLSRDDLTRTTTMDTFRLGSEHWGDLGPKPKSFTCHKHVPDRRWTAELHI